MILLELLTRTREELASRYEHALVEHGLRLVDLRITLAVCNSRLGMTAAAIARETEVDRQKVARRLRVLQRRGLVTLDRTNPKRTRARLTESGSAVQRNALAAVMHIEKDALAPLLERHLEFREGLRFLDASLRGIEIDEYGDPVIARHSPRGATGSARAE